VRRCLQMPEIVKMRRGKNRRDHFIVFPRK